ncbi:MAG: hypothetical protein Q7V88_03560 [Actinomycetota bacterium]|nr:hypothetical protein [Actinomycetota bacterium]
MSDLTDLLERIAPDPTIAPDAEWLWHAGRGRRRRGQVVRVAAVLALVGAAVGALSMRDGHELRPAGSSVPAGSAATTVQPVVPVPTYAGTVGSEHRLTWQQLAQPAFDLTGYSYVGTFTDGRLVLWNGTESMEAVDEPRDVRLAFYDATTDSWTRSAPFPVPQQFGNDAEVSVSDHVVVRQYDNGDDPIGNRFAVYVPAADTWTASPEMDVAAGSLEWAYDGTTIAALTAPPFDYVSTMAIARWVVGSDAWTVGAPSPLAQRGWPGLTHDGPLLAVYGGLTDEAGAATEPLPAGDPAVTGPTVGLAEQPGLAALDGAIYDVATDTWQMIERSPLRGSMGPTLMFAGTALVVSGGQSPAFQRGSWQTALYAPGIGWQLVRAHDDVTPADELPSTSHQRHSLLGQSFEGWFTLDAPYADWRAFPGAPVQTSWEPNALGLGRYLQATKATDGTVQFVYVDNTVATQVPTVPFTTSGESGWATVVAPTSDGVLLVSSLDLTVWMLQVDG